MMDDYHAMLYNVPMREIMNNLVFLHTKQTRRLVALAMEKFVSDMNLVWYKNCISRTGKGAYQNMMLCNDPFVFW